MSWECKAHQQLLMRALNRQCQKRRLESKDGIPDVLFQHWLHLIIQQKWWWCMMCCQIHNKQTGTTDSAEIFFMVSLSLLKCNTVLLIYLGSKNLTLHSPWFLLWHIDSQLRKLTMQMMAIWGIIHFKWRIWIYNLYIYNIYIYVIKMNIYSLLTECEVLFWALDMY